MTAFDSDETPKSVATEQLKLLGLSTYAARTFAALVYLGEGTAQEVSENAEVPRTRVYDAVSELREHNLVAVIDDDRPKRFRPVSVSETTRTFHETYGRRIRRLSTALAALETAD